MVDIDHPRLAIARQCELLSIARSSFYRTPCGESEMNLALMRLIDERFMECPWYGSRQMARHQLHTVPFGQLGQITNFSRDWSK